jgi:F-type H+-transporting ATPase subunit epsilon
MAETLKLEIVTPQGTVISEDVEMVTLPGIEGQLGIYPNHVPLITPIEPGEIIVTSGGRDRFLAVGDGLAEISRTQVSVITDMAIAADQIDEAKVEEARARAAARLEEKVSDEEIASVNASLARSLAQLQVKKRRRM